MIEPLVSVVIPTYNRACLLERSIRSVLSQSFRHWEAIIVDDGSVDDTPETVRYWQAQGHGRIRYLRRDHAGVSAARNAGIAAATGTFIAFLDADDEWTPDCLERKLRLFDLRPELGLVFSDFLHIAGERTAKRAFDSNCAAARQLPLQEVAPDCYLCDGTLFGALLRNYFIATITGMVRRTVLHDVRFDETQQYAEEWLFFLEVARRCRAGMIDRPLARHHHEPNSLTRAVARNTLGAYRIARAMEGRLGGLAGRERRALSARLVDTARQLGFDAMHENRPGDGLAYFGEALRLQPGVRALREWAACRWAWLVDQLGETARRPARTMEADG